MLLKADKNKLRQKRHMRVRNHIHDTAQRPRLNIYCSYATICAQIIDDEKGVTLIEIKYQLKKYLMAPTLFALAKKVGAAIAKQALDIGITEVVFSYDRYYFQPGAVKAFAEAARKAGLKF